MYNNEADARIAGGIAEFTFDDVHGSFFYGVDTVVTDAAFHAGLLNVGDTDDVFACYGSDQYDLVSTDAHGITSKYVDADYTFFPRTADDCYSSRPDNVPWWPLALEIDLGAVGRGGVVTGSTYYTISSTLNLVAYHMGLANPGDTVSVTPLTLAHGMPFLSSTRSFLTSNASVRIQPNVYLSLDDEVPPCTLHDTGFVATVFPSAAGLEAGPVDAGPDPFSFWNSTAISAATTVSGVLRSSKFGRFVVNVTLSGTRHPFCDELDGSWASGGSSSGGSSSGSSGSGGSSSSGGGIPFSSTSAIAHRLATAQSRPHSAADRSALLRTSARRATAQAHGVDPSYSLALCKERFYYESNSDNSGSGTNPTTPPPTTPPPTTTAAPTPTSTPTPTPPSTTPPPTPPPAPVQRRAEAQSVWTTTPPPTPPSTTLPPTTPAPSVWIPPAPPGDFVGYYGLSRSTCVPTLTRSASLNPQATVTKSTSRSIDAPTPAPPTPAPYTPAPYTPPPVAPTATVHATTIEPCGTTPIRPASCFVASVTYALNGATAVPGASPAVGFVVVLDAPAGAVIPAAATLPAGCIRSASGRQATCTHEVHFGSETLRVPFMTEAYPSAAPSLTASVAVTNWTPSSVVEAATYPVPAAVPPVPFNIPSVHSGLDPATHKPSVTATNPPMNALSYGTTVTLTGSRLALLPELLPLGPHLLRVQVAADALSATIRVLNATDAYRRGNATGTEPSMRAAMISYVSSHGSIIYSSLVPGLEGLAATYYINEVLTAESVNSLQIVRNETAPGQPLDLSRFNIDFTNGQIVLIPRVPSAFTPVPGAPGGPTYTTTTPRAVRPGVSGTIVPVYIPADFFVPGSDPDPSDNTIVLVLRPDAVITLSVDGDPNSTTYHVQPNVPITVTAVQGDGTTPGYWVDIPTTMPLPPLKNVSLVADPTDPTAVILTGGDPTVRITVVIESPSLHTTTTFIVEYTVVTYSVRLRPKTPYQVDVELRLDSGPSLDEPRVLAYTDEIASVRAYPTRSPDASCTFNSANVSTHCNMSSIVAAAVAARRQALVAVRAWGFTLQSSPPSYVTTDVIVRVHITTLNAAWKTLTIRLSKSVSPQGVIVSAPVSGSNPDDATEAPLDAPPLATTAASVVSLEDPTTEPSFGSAVSRGIFALVESGCRPALNILSFTLLVYVLVLMARGVHTVWMRRQASEAEDRIVTYGVPAWRSLLPNHVYAGVIVPCHHYCGPIHTTLFLVHILSLYTLCSALLASYHDVVTSSSGSYFSIALVCVIGAAVMQPIFNFPYTLYALIDRRELRARGSSCYGPQDLTSFGTWRQEFVGVTSTTVKTAAAIAYDEDGPQDLASLQQHQSQYREQDIARKVGVDGDSDKDEAPDTTIVALPRQQRSKLAPHATGSLCMASPTDEQHDKENCSPMACDSVIDAAESAAAAEGRSCARRDPRTCVIVNANMYVLAGHALNGLGAFGFALATASNTGSWCVAEFEEFYALFGAAVLLDLLAMQPLLLALTWAWRWLVDDGSSTAGGESEVEETSVGGVHELHPIHGQWRYEGPLLEADELSFDDDEKEEGPHTHKADAEP
jgi:hypothetical protein